MVGGVLAFGRFDDDHLADVAVKAGGDVSGVSAAGLVGVRHDNHSERARQRGGVLVSPLAGTPGTACGDAPGALQGLDVLLAFDDVDDVTTPDGAQNLG
jgi:hypothetical protein